MKFEDEKNIRKRFLGDVLRGWRERQELTQGQVADELGYSTAQFVSNWERGQSSPPLEVLPKLGQLYGLKSAEIVKTVERYHAELVAQKTKVLRAFLRAPKKR